MAVDMTVAMAAWMVIRRHTWPRIVEMSAAMVLPFRGAAGAVLAGRAVRGGTHDRRSPGDVPADAGRDDLAPRRLLALGRPAGLLDLVPPPARSHRAGGGPGHQAPD